MTHTHADGDEAERFDPATMSGGLIEAEHRARYLLAASVVAGKKVLDAGCGVGWGSAVLLGAGAESVTGLDLAAEAVERARADVSDAEFVEGNLLDLPFEDASFDVVVCFEALEHTGDTAATIDQLARVLRADGVLLVSSPNPDVYPEGNPFHTNEERPDVLLAIVEERLPNAQLWHQRMAIASVVRSADAEPSGSAHVTELVTMGHDPYGIVIAGRGELPQVTSIVVTAPSDQLDHLDAAGKALLAERNAFAEQESAVAAERADLQGRVAEAEQQLADLAHQVAAGEARLVEADAALQTMQVALTTANDAHVGALEVIADRDSRLAQARETVARAESIADGLRATLDGQRLVAENAARERDELSLALIEERQLRAKIDSVIADRVGGAVSASSVIDLAEEVRQLRAERDALLGELVASRGANDALYTSTSWRVTGPLRAVARRIKGQ